MTEIAEFSIWAVVRPADKREFRKWMANQTGLREIDVHSWFGGAVDEGQPIELLWNLGWEVALAEIERLPPFVITGSARLTVTSFSPREGNPYCTIHSLFTWRIGCPVCSNNFIRHGRTEQQSRYRP